ncbi:MAG: fused response regulator/phosphatase [Celeribacter sp.]|jgi:sigma-B regulation protein RsbU (phosphoserine phosphatase)
MLFAEVLLSQPTLTRPVRAAPAGGGRPCVLLVDDSLLQLRILSTALGRWGYRVRQARSADEALAICGTTRPDLVISDWIMPGMSGPEFCRRFRDTSGESYGYFILLTSKRSAHEVAQGLDAGADDFLTKPVNLSELRARMKAGERILRMQRELIVKNELISETLGKISLLYDALDRDLQEARKLQQSLVKEPFRRFARGQVSLLLRPSGHIGGDLVGFFPIRNDLIGLFAIDVSGHGVTSALLTARIAAHFSGSAAEGNIALHPDPGAARGRPPQDVAARLNALLLREIETEHYCTMVYVEADLATGRLRGVQAGHPHPLIQRCDGTLERIGRGGLPVGLLGDARYEAFHATLAPGDRLLLASDGMTECPDRHDRLLDEAGLVRLMRRNQAVRGPDFLKALTRDLSRHADAVEFPDDISAVLLEYEGGTDA